MKTDEAILPENVDALIARLRDLRLQRIASRDPNRKRRRRIIVHGKARREVLRKTGGRCHICGGLLGEKWQADHVLAYSNKGEHSTANLLPAHRLCNRYRLDYLAEEFQWILKIGVWARTRMRKSALSKLGREMAEEFFKYDNKNKGKKPKEKLRTRAAHA